MSDEENEEEDDSSDDSSDEGERTENLERMANLFRRIAQTICRSFPINSFSTNKHICSVSDHRCFQQITRITAITTHRGGRNSPWKER